MNWSKVTLKQYIELTEVEYTNPIETGLELIRIFFNNTDPTIVEYTEYLAKLEFLKDKPIPNKLKDKYTLNNRVYTLQTDINKITVAQYQDIQLVGNNLIDFMSCILIPENKSYLDYDMNLVKEDIATMNIQDSLAISFFYQRVLENFQDISLMYLQQEKKRALKLKK